MRSKKIKTRHSRRAWVFPRMTAFFGSLIVAHGLALTNGWADGSTKADTGSRPNIMFLYTDDQAQWAMGAYGNQDIKTPHLDSLARSGAIFRDAFTVTPVNAVQLMRYRHISSG
jgi:Sulfatase